MIKGWKNTIIGDLVKFQRGHDLPDSQREDGNIPVVGSAGINGYHNQVKAKAPGVTIGRSGASIGKAFYINQDYWPHNAALYVKDFKGNHPKFVYYFLKSTDFSFLNSGSAQPSLNRNILHAIKVVIPPLETQKKIAAILSAYDDLIENNKRRIALLEKMAEEIYREWFVRFRFPGWQNTEFEKGIPKDWKISTLGNSGNYINGYAFKPTDWFSEGLPIIKIKELTSVISENTPRNQGEDISQKYFIDDGDLIFSWSATLLVQIWNQGRGILNQHLFKIEPKKDIPRDFLYFAILFALPIFESLTTGATMKHIKRKELHMVKLPIPDQITLSKFEEKVQPITNHILILHKKNRLLEQTKNSLLPRLISGKLSVEELDIAFPPSMQ